MENIVLNNIDEEKIVAVTVTYNRTQTLKKTINALLKQTISLYKIIIVDNNSNPAEKEIINKIALQSSIIDVIWLDENLGGAGGFEVGMRRALEEYRPDWYWIMDDDAYPTPLCLQTLLSYKSKLNNIGCLAPIIYGIDNKNYQMYHHKIITKYTMKDKKIESNYSNLGEVTKITANAFVGPLFNKEAVETLGVADGTLFIYGDDTEYTYRISRKYGIYLIKSAVIEHQDPPSSNNIVSPNFWWKEYYEIRNRFLFINKFQTNILNRFFVKIYLSYILMKKILISALGAEYKGYKVFRIRLLLKTWRDGMFNKKGKTIDPVEYFKVINEMQNNV